MGQAFLDKLQSILARYTVIVADQPVLFGVFAAVLVVFTLAVVVAVLRGRARTAYWWAVGLIVVDFCLSWGDDTFTHVFRIADLADQVRAGSASQLLIDPGSGEALPVFVYYSLVPYLLPVLLDLAGLPAMLAYKAVGALQFVVMAAGVAALVDKVTAGSPRNSRDGDREYLAALLFVTAAYVWSLWCTRASLAEYFVVSLVPWVTRYLVVPNGQRALVLLFSLQVAAHPVVLLHGLVCELLVAYALSRTSLLEMIRRIVVPLVLALALASPFWLPQFLWQSWILGPGGLPVRFIDTFLTWRELFDPRHVHNIGLWLPLAIALAVVVAPRQLSLRFWLLVAATGATLAIQTVYLRPLAVHVPMLGLSLFVWRLLFPAAFLAFGALLVGAREVRLPARPLGALAILSVVSMVWVMASVSPNYLRKLAASGDDSFARRQHHESKPVWGVREFLPENTRLPRLCPPEPERQAASYRDLRAGVVTTRPFLVVSQAPLGIVDYRAGATSLAPAACDEQLVLGPLPAGTRVSVSETWLDGLLVIRLLALAAFVILPFAWPARRRPPAIARRTY
jgi:hypothetical protein